ASARASAVADGGLPDRADHHLVDVHMGWPGHSPDDAVSDIGPSHRFHALVDRGGALLVALESHQAELGLHHAWLDLGHPDGLAEKLQAEGPGDGADGMLAGGV